MLFDKIGRKFYSPDDETGAELHATGETIYSGDKPYLNTEVEPPLFTEFQQFNDFAQTPYAGMLRFFPIGSDKD